MKCKRCGKEVDGPSFSQHYAACSAGASRPRRDDPPDEVVSALAEPERARNSAETHDFERAASGATLAFYRAQGDRALAAAAEDRSNAGEDSGGFIVRHIMTAGTTSATTFKFRYGPNSGTAFINRGEGGQTLGGVAPTRMTITEVSA